MKRAGHRPRERRHGRPEQLPGARDRQRRQWHVRLARRRIARPHRRGCPAVPSARPRPALARSRTARSTTAVEAVTHERYRPGRRRRRCGIVDCDILPPQRATASRAKRGERSENMGNTRRRLISATGTSASAAASQSAHGQHKDSEQCEAERRSGRAPHWRSFVVPRFPFGSQTTQGRRPDRLAPPLASSPN